MDNILHELYYDNVEVQLQKTCITDDLRDKLRVLSEKEEAFRKGLSDEALKQFNEYTRKYVEYQSLSCCDSFMCGFKYGARFIYDTFVADNP